MVILCILLNCQRSDTILKMEINNDCTVEKRFLFQGALLQWRIFAA